LEITEGDYYCQLLQAVSRRKEWRIYTVFLEGSLFHYQEIRESLPCSRILAKICKINDRISKSPFTNQENN
jgi:hypothetical protein